MLHPNWAVSLHLAPFTFPYTPQLGTAQSIAAEWKLGPEIILRAQQSTPRGGEETLQLTFSHGLYSFYFCVTGGKKAFIKLELVLAFQLTARPTLLHFPKGERCPEIQEICSTSVSGLAFCSYFQQWVSWVLSQNQCQQLPFCTRYRVKRINNRTHHRITRYDATGNSTVQLPCNLPLTHMLNSVNWTNWQNTTNPFNSRILTFSSQKYVLTPVYVHPSLPFISWAKFISLLNGIC